MQDIKNIYYPFDASKYYADISSFPPVISSDTSSINFNTCSKPKTEWSKISELSPDYQCVCKDSEKKSKIIEGNQFYKCQ